MRSFLLLKNLRSCLYFFAIIRATDLCCLHFESIGNCQEDMAEKGGVSTEGNHSTRHPNMLVHLVILALILIIKLIKV